MKNLDDVMRRLTFLKNVSDGNDQFDKELNVIAEMLEIFGVKWSFVEDNEKFVAKLKQH